ncbi:MAG: hypothetical protein ABIL66_08875 [candidate division WOR-3 bacterium]
MMSITKSIKLLLLSLFVFAEGENNKIFLGVDISGSFFKFAPEAVEQLLKTKILSNETKGKRNLSFTLIRIDDETNLDDILYSSEYSRFNSLLHQIQKTKKFLKGAQRLIASSNPSPRTDFLGFFQVVAQKSSPDDNVTLLVLSDGIHNTPPKNSFEMLKRINGKKKLVLVTNGAQYLNDRWQKSLNDAGFTTEIYTIEMLQFNTK